jgi:putative ABC transport system substrate-binding protein
VFQLISRRSLFGGTVAAGLTARLPVLARPGAKVYRIGHVTSGNRTQDAVFLAALEDGLKRLGYTAGRNLQLEYRFADGQVDRLPALVDELVRLNVDAIVAGSNHTISLAQRATSSIPIVMTLAGDPVSAGFAESLARPGANITGLAVDVTPDIAGKRLSLVKEAVPTVARVAVLWEPVLAASRHYWDATVRAATPLRVLVRSFELRQAADLEMTLRTIGTENIDGLFVFFSPITLRHAADITAFALQRHLPSVYGVRAYTERAGLLSYGPDLADSYRRAATYLDRIFRGVKPSELPVEQPTEFELVINLRTAKALGLTIPPAVLARADEVIQ